MFFFSSLINYIFCNLAWKYDLVNDLFKSFAVELRKQFLSGDGQAETNFTTDPAGKQLSLCVFSRKIPTKLFDP